MRFLHTSDLHIGKTVCGFSMLEEQRFVLEQMLSIVKEKEIDVVLLSGDLYDRALPPSQAVTILDDFLTRLIQAGVQVCAIAGNHDSGERIAFANRILEGQKLFMEGTLKKEVRYVDWKKDGEAVRIHMIPYGKPAQVRDLFGGEVTTSEDAMEEILKHVAYHPTGKNILMAHQFAVNQGQEPELSDSETRVSVGGTDQVEVGNFAQFDYVALGHIHGPQRIGRGPVYYSGSPVKYSFSEVFHKKSVIIGEWDQEGQLKVEKVLLKPLHDMRKIKGKLADLLEPDVVSEGDAEDYIMAILTNEEELVDPIGTLRSVYPNVMQLQIERMHMEGGVAECQGQQWKEKTPYEMFHQFYEFVMDQELTPEQEEIVKQAVTQAKEAAL